MYEKSIELLNKAVADELSAVHQYMYFHFHCDDQGYDLLSGLFKKIAIEEMMHIERIADRILFLKGDIEMKPSAEVLKTHDVKQMLDQVCEMERQAIQAYNTWAMECASHADSVSRKLFEDLVADEERHFGLFDNEQGNMEKFGVSYLALQSIERSKTASTRTTPGGGGAA